MAMLAALEIQPQVLHLLIARLHCGARRDLRLEEHPHVVQVGEVLPHQPRVVAELEHERVELVPLARVANAHAASVTHVDEASRGERADHLARRRLRDAELGADVALGRRGRLLPDLPVDDASCQRPRDLIAQLDRPHRFRRVRHQPASCMVTI